MPVVMMVESSEFDAALYDSVMEAMDWENTEKPAGFISHVAGPGPNGWLVIDVWESEADFQAFVQTRLGAAMAEAAGGQPPAIEPVFFPVHNMDRVAATV